MTPPDPRTAEERLHEDDSYGNCITCREYIAHTDDETVPVAWPCAVERLRQSIDAATGYRRSHQDDCQCGNCRDYDALIDKASKPEDVDYGEAVVARAKADPAYREMLMEDADDYARQEAEDHV